MEELIDRGYKEGYYGLALGGNSTTYNIKLLIELSKVKHFYAFIMHDLDLDGLKIFFDMKKWFQCESIGLNPEMLAFSGISFDQGSENYKPKNKENTIKHLNNVIKKYTPEEQEVYKNWISICEDKRFELNSLTAIRLREDSRINKARDFVDYLLTKIEEVERKWNLVRLRKPQRESPSSYDFSISKPKIIRNVEYEIEQNIETITNKLDDLIQTIYEKQEEIKEKAGEPLSIYLESINLLYSSDWEELVKDHVNKISNSNKILHNLLDGVGRITCRRILKELKKYAGSETIKQASNIILDKEWDLNALTRNQNNTLQKIIKKQKHICNNLIKKTLEYKEVKKELMQNKKKYVSINLTALLDNIEEDLKLKIEDLSLEQD